MSPNEKLLAAIRQRGFDNRQSPFGMGILTADRWVKTLEQCVGIDACYKFAATRTTSFDDVMRKAASALTYRNPDMGLIGTDLVKVSGVSIDELEIPGGSSIELPKNWLLVFRHTLTTPRKDRDGDILRTEGVVINEDIPLPLLWQHVHTLPIGKMLAIILHNNKTLDLISAVVGRNELCQDAAVMIDDKVVSFSHGFRALEFEELKEQEGETTSPGGFDVKRLEIMEESAVSVPSNIDAQHDETILSMVEGGKLTSPLMKEHGKTIRAARPISVPVEIDLSVTVRNKTGESNADQSGNRAAAGKGCGCSASAPKEADVGANEEAKTEGAENAEVSNRVTISNDKRGPLEGSWEWIEHRLRHQAERFLALTGSISMINRFAWIVGTFADHAIVCAETRDSAGPDEFLYFKVTWEMVDGGPRFTGQPAPVDLVTTAEIRERSPMFEEKQNLSDGKAGRVLSQANLHRLEDVKAGIEELSDKETDMTRGGKAICEICIRKLDEVISTASVHAESSHAELTVRSAAALFMAEASSAERRALIGILEALEQSDETRKQTANFRALIGAGENT